MRSKYLISEMYYKRALTIAKEMDLQPNEWIYIPLDSTSFGGIRTVLHGKRVDELKYLIGDFTLEERDYLLNK